MLSFPNKSRTFAFSFKGSIPHPLLGASKLIPPLYSGAIFGGWVGAQVQGSVYNPGWLVTHNVDQDGLELTETCL